MCTPVRVRAASAANTRVCGAGGGHAEKAAGAGGPGRGVRAEREQVRSVLEAASTNNTAVTLVVLDGESVLAVTVTMQRIKDECAVKTEGGCRWQFHRICCWECPQLRLLQNRYKYRGCWDGEISLTVVYFNVFARSPNSFHQHRYNWLQ